MVGDPKPEPVAIDLAHLTRAQIIPSEVGDLTHKTLLLDFDQPLRVLSTLAGFQEQISSVGNHYLPSGSQGHYDGSGLLDLHARTCHLLNRPAKASSLLFTGVDVHCHSLQRQHSRGTVVYALVTAGVITNAAHMVRDRGEYHEAGTINVILLSNRSLCERAMTQALIVATEAKTAALHDLDIRSSYTPLQNGATGTGTDGILVTQGTGPPVEYAGGHTKIGELIAKAVYAGVIESIARWESLTRERGILQRLKERRIDLPTLIDQGCHHREEISRLLTELLEKPRYASFLASALAIEDDFAAGLISDLAGFQLWCGMVADELAGEKLAGAENLIKGNGPLLMAINALIVGLSHHLSASDSSSGQNKNVDPIESMTSRDAL